MSVDDRRNRQIGSNILSLRTEKGLSAEKVAEKMSGGGLLLNEDDICDIERGVMPVKASWIPRLARVLDASIDDLFTDVSPGTVEISAVCEEKLMAAWEIRGRLEIEIEEAIQELMSDDIRGEEEERLLEKWRRIQSKPLDPHPKRYHQHDRNRRRRRKPARGDDSGF